MIDELELLNAAKPEAQPDAATVERHREQLQAATADSRRESAKAHRRRAPFAVAAAALVVAGAAVALTRDDGRTTVATDPDPTASTATAPAPTVPVLTCGTSVPADLTVPGSTGPIAGPSPEGRPVDDGQFAQYWSRPEGDVELRWPARAPLTYDLHPAPSGSVTMSMSGSPGRAEFFVADPEDRDVMTRPVDADVTVSLAGHPTPPAGCELLEVIIHENGAASRLALDFTDLEAPVELGSLITAQTDVPSGPTEVEECDAPSNIPTPPNRGGNGSGAVFPAPADALRAFLESPDAEFLSKSGYTELREGDGTFTYAVPLYGDPSRFVTLISVVPADAGWAVEWWKASGC